MTKKKWLTIAGTIVLLLLIPVVIFAIPQTRQALISKVSNSIDSKELLAKPVKPAEKQVKKPEGPEVDTNYRNPNVVNILFLGIDRTEERDETLGIYRADTITVWRIDLEKHNMKMLSIPRDTYAYLPMQNRTDKINHSYAFGSKKGKAVESTISAVNNLIKYSEIDYYFTLDMEPIPNIVDDLGGVEIDVELDMKSHGANLSKGLQVLNGRQAFDYIHWRYSGMGDIDRIKRQQKLMRAIYKKIRDKNMFFEAIQIVMKYNKNVKTDLTTPQLLGLGKIAKEIPDDKVSFHYIPGHPRNIKKISYWEKNEQETEQVLKEIFQEDSAKTEATVKSEPSNKQTN